MATLKVLINFTGAAPTGNGIYASAGLLMNATGDLFGTTDGGGQFGTLPTGDGTVFEIPYIQGRYASAPTMLVSFSGADGSAPQASLIANAAGDLFSTTWMGGTTDDGTVFELPSTDGSYPSTPTTLVNFIGTDGISPIGGLYADAAGDLFGDTYLGGTNGDGTLFEIPHTGSSYASTPTTLVNFNGDDGANPDCVLIADAAGDLFGTAINGGANGDGTVWELPYTNGSYAASTPTTLVSFDGTDGAQPIDGVIADPAGDLFGTTYSGGQGGYGTVFEIPYIDGSYASTPTTLVSFDGTDGANPHASLIIDAAGDLFGTTSGVNIDLAGTVFEVAKTADGYASTPTTLANVTYPVGNLIADGAGDLFSTTAFGGANGAGTVFELTDTGFAVCFLAGTLIATPTGELPVEQLVAGNMAMTLGGQARRIVWIGEGHVLATRGRRNAATPVIVRNGALANNVPHRDLRVTKGHSLFLDGVLIPVEHLVNHRSIIWDERAREVTLYHIELETHDVLIADGAPAESYRDDGNRWQFRNANSGWCLPPQPACAPVLTGGPIVDAVWRRLVDRTASRNGPPLTHEPDLHLLVDGKRIDAIRRSDGEYAFRLMTTPRQVRIRSRAAVPQEIGVERDERALGVALRRIVLAQPLRQRAIDARDTSLSDGFHKFESDHALRWTNGDAAIPAELFAGAHGPFMLMLQLGATAQYIDEGNPVTEWVA